MKSSRKGKEAIWLGPILLTWGKEEERDITGWGVLLEEQGFGATV